MAVSQRTMNQLWGRAGARCYLDRSEELSRTQSGDVLVGEVAHIIGRKHSGPRGRSKLTRDERDLIDNLVLLCPTHHREVDKNPKVWTVKRLRNLTEDYDYSEAIETLGRKALSDGSALVRRRAMERFRHTTNPRLLKEMAELEDDPDEEVAAIARACAARSERT